MRRRCVLVLVAATMIAVLGTGCAPVHVQSFTERDAPFAAARSYRWADDGARATGDPRLDSNPFFERRIMAAADAALRGRGFERRAADDADLVLHYHASVSQALDTARIDREFGVCAQCRVTSVYDAGTLMLDFVERRTNRLVWRGWAEGSIDGMVDDQAWLDAHIDRAIARIVDSLPRP